MSKYRILSIDGGGVRGILAARILQRLDTFSPGFLTETDLFAGTSAGSIIAMALANGTEPASLVELFRSKSGLIFRDTILHKVLSAWGILGAKYSTQDRLAAIHPVFGEITLKDLPKKVLIATFRLDSGHDFSCGIPANWKSKLFHNFLGLDSDGAQKAIDVVMRSTAAPTYFPIYQGYIDGGVAANNPAMCALAQAIEPETGGQNIEDVVLLSVSSGTKPQTVDSYDGNWGLKQWGFPIIDLLLEAGPGLADFQCRQLLQERYFRIDILLPEVINLDDTSKIDRLIELADDADLHAAGRWLRDIWL